MPEHNSDKRFGDFIWKERTNRIYLFSALSITMIIWFLFKLAYTQPNIIFDSYFYIKAAVLHQNVNAWPIGYSKFLQFLALFSHKANLFVFIQYLLQVLACLFFFFTWLYIFSPDRPVTILVFLFLFLNPLFICCSNYILSDSLFISLSLLWVTQLLWIIYAPRPSMIVTHAILLMLAFTVRYNALYYPVVATFAFLLSRQKWRPKLIGIILPMVLILGFVHYTRTKNEQTTGPRQFSAFGSWKLASNALYAYRNVPPDKIEPVPEKFKMLDSTVRDYFAVTPGLDDTLAADPSFGSYFMFDPRAPLVRYLERVHLQLWPIFGTNTWFQLAPLYQEYGSFLIRKYPWTFARFFIWPNVMNYFVPIEEIFTTITPFHLHESHGGQFVRQMFGLNDITIDQKYIDMSILAAWLYSKIFTLFHAVFILGIIGFIAVGGFKRVPKSLAHCLLIIISLWGCDFFFSILTANIVLRYQIFMMILEMSLGLYFIRFTYSHLDSSIHVPNHQPETSK